MFVLIASLIGLAQPGHSLEARIMGPMRVIDGDTVDIGGTRIRLHGIDAPEAGQTCTSERGVVWGCGDWVSDQVRALYQGRTAVCRSVDTDRYGRTVARCRVEGRDIGDRLVQAGLAFAYRKYSTEHVAAEQAAARAGTGLHRSTLQTPAQHRQTRARGRLPDNGGCRIKGNISAKGARIYHVAGQRDYERTGIRPEKGERWFCSEAEAQDAGWRRARR